MENNKQKKLSEITVEEFEFILDKLADRLIYGLQNIHYNLPAGDFYKYMRENNPQVPNRFEVWCENKNFNEGEGIQ